MDMEIQPVPWWNRRSRMERRFIYLIASLLLVSVGLAIGKIVRLNGQSEMASSARFARYFESTYIFI